MVPTVPVYEQEPKLWTVWITWNPGTQSKNRLNIKVEVEFFAVGIRENKAVFCDGKRGNCSLYAKYRLNFLPRVVILSQGFFRTQKYQRASCRIRPAAKFSKSCYRSVDMPYAIRFARSKVNIRQQSKLREMMNIISVRHVSS